MLEKTCPACKQTLEVTKFSRESRRKDGLRPYCKACSNEKKREWYNSIRGHPENWERFYANTRRYRTRNRNYVTAWLLEHPCVDCKEADLVVLDFDHVRGVKRAAISKLMSESRSLETIIEEIAKCEVRCSNCHRRRTARTRGRKDKQQF